MLAAAKSGVLENMRDACGVLRHRAQRHEEHIFWIVRSQVVMYGTGVAVLKLLHAQVQRVDAPLTQGNKTVVGDRELLRAVHRLIPLKVKSPILT